MVIDGVMYIGCVVEFMVFVVIFVVFGYFGQVEVFTLHCCIQMFILLVSSILLMKVF